MTFVCKNSFPPPWKGNTATATASSYYYFSCSSPRQLNWPPCASKESVPKITLCAGKIPVNIVGLWIDAGQTLVNVVIRYLSI